MSTAITPRKLSHTHIAIMDFMLANPTAPLGLVALHFGYTPAWLSSLIHCDAFQSMLNERQQEIFGDIVMVTIKDRITGVAHQALDRLSEKLDVEKDTRVIKDSAEMLLRSLGWGQQAKGGATVNVQSNVVVLADKATLATSRRLLANANDQPGGTPEVVNARPGDGVDCSDEGRLLSQLSLVGGST